MDIADAIEVALGEYPIERRPGRLGMLCAGSRAILYGRLKRCMWQRRQL
jgi:hypothetical protein